MPKASTLPKHALIKVGWTGKEQGETEQERNARITAINNLNASEWADWTINSICKRIASGEITPHEDDVFVPSSQSKEFNKILTQLKND